MDRIIDECRKCDGQLICRDSITPGHTACELFRKKRARNTMEISETDNQQLKDAIALLRKCCGTPNYQETYSDLRAEVLSFVQHASV